MTASPECEHAEWLKRHHLQPADCGAFREALALIRDRAKGTSAERWIEDSAAIHNLAFMALKEHAQ
jgi:hypothetical protein